MLYKEYLPHPYLRDRVECYWKFVVEPVTDGSIEPLSHVFPPDGSCSLLFINMASFHHKAIVFVGPTTIIKEIPVFSNSISFGIRLKPGCSLWLNATEPAAIANSVIQYQPEDISAWQQEILTQMELSFDNKALLDDILMKVKPESSVEPDARIVNVVDFVIARNGQATLTEVADVSHLSPRQLQRLFTKETGIAIKQFCQMRRLRKAIIDLHIQHRTYPEMVAERGFADQAHYYKSFKNVAGYDIRKFISYIGQIEHIMV
nr:helix-turn-helix transcriptional regulator [uncultured Mucilaginibacter sp.]